MSKSSSILTALPNMKMYCIRLENSHMSRSRASMFSCCGDCAGSADDSISARPRFREGILGVPAPRKSAESKSRLYLLDRCEMVTEGDVEDWGEEWGNEGSKVCETVGSGSNGWVCRVGITFTSRNASMSIPALVQKQVRPLDRARLARSVP